MPHFDDLARESVGILFSEVISADRFKKWRAGIVANTLNQYAFGEIFWKKSLGLPNTKTLSEAVTVEAWRVEMELVGDIGGVAHWQPLQIPYRPSWWDGKDDSTVIMRICFSTIFVMHPLIFKLNLHIQTFRNLIFSFQ